jgi:hypothetical protein
VNEKKKATPNAWNGKEMQKPKITPGLLGAFVGAVTAPPIVIFCWSVLYLSNNVYGRILPPNYTGAAMLAAILNYTILFAVLGMAGGVLAKRQTTYTQSLLAGLIIGGIAFPLVLFLTHTHAGHNPFTGLSPRLTLFGLFLPILLSAVTTTLAVFHIQNR